MDGFKANEGVIVIGATNRTSDLDKALLRPGRFDTQVTVGLPDVKGRTEIIELYLDKIKASTEIDVDTIAKRTSGFSGADVQNLVNTAAIRAAVEGKLDFIFCNVKIIIFNLQAKISLPWRILNSPMTSKRWVWI